MAQTHFSGPVVQGTDLRPNAATNVFSSRTVVSAAASVEGALVVAGAFNPAAGLTFADGTNNVLAAGTYFGSGAATAAIVTTNLTTVRHVWMNRLMTNNSAPNGAATTINSGIPAPALAAATTTSFYPYFLRTGASGAATLGLGAGATISWIAIGAA
jgi:hypothetical protein